MIQSSKITIPPHVIARQVGEEVVILDLSKGTYFGLDPVGARIWQLMGENNTLAEICDAMQEDYDVTREDIERDVVGLAERLMAQQLVAFT